MTTRMIRLAILVYMISLSITGCGTEPITVPTNTPEPTATPVPTQTPIPTSTVTPIPTPTLTPIPGLETPIVINEIGFQVVSVVVAVESAQIIVDPQFNKVMSIELALTGADVTNMDLLFVALDSLIKDLVVLDDKGSVIKASNYFVPMSNPEGVLESVTFYFVVRKETTSFSLKFPDGQTIDLTPLLDFR